jgi:GT2 family glycosyltransferase
MISIITAIYNQLNMNIIYYESLVRYTKNEFELIVIDNGSTDGSREYFEKQKNVRVIRNDKNYSYPYCQNQGIRAAKFDYLVFANNDLIVSKHWDERSIRIMKANGLEVASNSATDRMETPQMTYKFHKRWKYIKNPLLFLFGARKWNLYLMFHLMFRNWEKWNDRRFEQFGNQVIEGISGSCVWMTRSAVEKIGLWDERMQGADFDIFLRTKKYSIETRNIKPAHIIPGVYVHHFIRLTLKKVRPVFADAENLISLREKWNADEARILLKNTDLVL